MPPICLLSQEIFELPCLPGGATAGGYHSGRHREAVLGTVPLQFNTQSQPYHAAKIQQGLSGSFPRKQKVKNTNGHKTDSGCLGISISCHTYTYSTVSAYLFIYIYISIHKHICHGYVYLYVYMRMYTPLSTSCVYLLHTVSFT